MRLAGRVCFTFFGEYPLFNRLVSVTDRVAIGQVELHPFNIGFVGDSFRVQLENDRIADLFRDLGGFVFALGDTGFYSGDAVSSQELLSFIFSQNCTTRTTRLLDDRGSRVVIRWVFLILRQ